MPYFVYLFSGINLYVGARFVLNAVGVLQTSKYSNTANVFMGLILLAAGVGAFYLSIVLKKNAWATWTNAAPWIVTLVLLLINMLTGDYK